MLRAFLTASGGESPDRRRFRSPRGARSRLRRQGPSACVAACRRAQRFGSRSFDPSRDLATVSPRPRLAALPPGTPARIFRPAPAPKVPPGRVTLRPHGWSSPPLRPVPARLALRPSDPVPLPFDFRVAASASGPALRPVSSASVVRTARSEAECSHRPIGGQLDVSAGQGSYPQVRGPIERVTNRWREAERTVVAGQRRAGAPLSSSS
jgi:hypothetical protein